ncbi:Na+/H+ antiporter NhaA, partial [Pseudomonas aeruginosa]|uniref:Na+/H+ antiporter NhaA n=1 Tax=Pseudomonas aeruginosa TaxID=287 RepID=UPI002F9270A4
MNETPTRAPSWPGYREVHRVTTLLRRESVGGMLLVVAAVAAIIWANSPASDAYF